MTPEVKQRLFEPFFTTKERSKGTGLGLATVYGIVMQSGGGVDVQSTPGMGTSFTIYLPRIEERDEAVPAAPSATRSRAAGETVLVVEDADRLRGLVKRMLERQGYTVLLAANAAQAVRQFEQHPSVDIVLTDVIMPGGSGPDLIKLLTEIRPGIKVIYMSGYTDDAISHHGVLDPGIVLVHKPFTAELLDRKIRDVLDR